MYRGYTRLFLAGTPSKLILGDFTSGTLAFHANQKNKEIAQRSSEISAKIANEKGARMAPNGIDHA